MTRWFKRTCIEPWVLARDIEPWVLARDRVRETEIRLRVKLSRDLDLLHTNFARLSSIYLSEPNLTWNIV